MLAANRRDRVTELIDMDNRTSEAVVINRDGSEWRKRRNLLHAGTKIGWLGANGDVCRRRCENIPRVEGSTWGRKLKARVGQQACLLARCQTNHGSLVVGAFALVVAECGRKYPVIGTDKYALVCVECQRPTLCTDLGVYNSDVN